MNRRQLAKISIAVLLNLVLATAPAAFAKKVKLKKLPNNLDKHGLVIFQVGPNAWDNAMVNLKPGRNSNAHDGFYIEKLKPGKYTLEGISRVTGGDYSTFAGTSITTTNYATLPINREFEIQAGKITHLGLLYLISEPGQKDAEGTQVIMLSFSNPGPEQRYLQKYYPKLAATITPADVIVSEHNYSNDKLGVVRDVIYKLYANEGMKLKRENNRFASFNVKHPVLFSDSGWAYGDLGIVARPVNGKVRILASETVDHLNHIGTVGNEEWFYSQAGALYHTVGDKLVAADSLPADFFVASGFKLNDSTLALVDKQFNLLVSADSAKSWSKSTEYSIGKKQALNVSYSLTGDHAYIIGRDHSLIMKQPRVVVVNRKSGESQAFDAPTKILKNMVAAFETEAGLFVQTENLGSTPSTLHFRPNGSQEWIKNEIMSFYGCHVSIAAPSAEQIEALCGFGRVRLISNDLGASWQPVQETLSQTAN